jgi:thioredoxin 2
MTAPSDAPEAAGVMRCPKCGKKNRVPAVASGTPRCGNCKAPLPWVVDVGDDRFSAVADESSLPVLVDLWAPWCAPCRMVSPVLEQLATDMAGRLKLVKVNADVAPQVSRRFEAQAIPTLVLLDRGRVVARQVGAAPADELRRWLEQALAGRAA